MKKSVLVGLVSLLTFVAGVAVNSSSQTQKSPYSQKAQTALATSTPTPCPDPFPRLIDNKYVTKFNGTRINLDYDTGVMSGDIPWAVDAAKVIPLKGGDILVNLGDSLYRLNRQQHVVWRHPTAQTVFDYAFVASTNLVYATAGDNIMFILNATTGKEEFSYSRNGRAAYGVAKEYGDDMCLVTDNFVMYRDGFRDKGLEPMKDGITCWRGTKILWHLDFPPDAELVVSGKRILAVTKSKTAIYVNEITPPQTKSE
jgi:outer membrane protein assembly factor BamB